MVFPPYRDARFRDAPVRIRVRLSVATNIIILRSQVKKKREQNAYAFAALAHKRTRQGFCRVILWNAGSPASEQFFSALLHSRTLRVSILLPAPCRRKAKFAAPCTLQGARIKACGSFLPQIVLASALAKSFLATTPRCAALRGSKSNIIRKSLALRCEQFRANRFLAEQGSRRNKEVAVANT